MWHQRLHWATYSLVAVLVIAGSLALFGCNSEDDGPIGATTVRLTNATNERANVNDTNIQLLRDRGGVVADPFNPGFTVPVSGAVVIDAAAFGFDPAIAPDQLTSTVQITNIRRIVFPTATGTTASTPLIAPSSPHAASFASPEACPRLAPATVAGAPVPQLAAAPIAAADYTISRSDGVIYTGTLCIGAGTTGVVATPTSSARLGAGGNICIFTNFANSLLPGAQQVFSTCRIVVQTGTNPGIPADGLTGTPGSLQLALSNPGPSGAGPLSLPISTTVVASDNGDNTASISATDVLGNPFPTGIVVGF
jgi:hypothetical protein